MQTAASSETKGTDPLLLSPRTEDGRLRRGPGFAVRRATTSLRRLPDFLVIGAMKSGTSTLFHHLVRHPGVDGPIRKEVHFFGHADRMGRGLGWYRAHFPLRGGAGLVGEATPSYLFDPDAPARIALALPGVRLLAILREPVARAISHYHHEVRMGRETLPMEDAFALEDARLARAEAMGEAGRETVAHASYRRRGLYADQIERYHATFGRERLLILGMGELVRDPQAAVGRAIAFLGLPPAPVEIGAILNRGAHAEPTPGTLAERLAAWFDPHNDRLRGLLDGRLPDWD